MTSQTPITALPEAAIPYVLEAGCGLSGLLLGQTTRILVGGSQSGGRLAVVAVIGPQARPIPFHSHREARDSFYVTRGQVQVWADDQSRILSAGDFAYVAPGSPHAYGFTAPICETVGVITPGGWEEFFTFTSTPYSGAMFPPVDTSPPPFERLGQAPSLHDVTFRRDLEPFDANGDGPGHHLPVSEQSYFLRAESGPRHLMLGQVCTQLATGAQTGGTFGMVTIEGGRGAVMPLHLHRGTHEVLYVLGGRLRITLNGQETLALPGDCVSIPAGCVHGYRLEGHANRLLVMNAAAGSERLFELAGEAWPHAIFPDAHPAPGDTPDLAGIGSQLDFVLAEETGDAAPHGA